MARILLFEPHQDICDLLRVVVRRLGHEPVVYDGRPDAHLGAAVAILEPGAPGALLLARRLRAAGATLLFTSIFPPDQATLTLEPAAYLVKPFALAALERALAQALPPRPAGHALSTPV